MAVRFELFRNIAIFFPLKHIASLENKLVFSGVWNVVNDC